MKIAVVDDERLIVDGLIRIIGRQYPEAELQGFTDAREALARLSSRLPDLLITDIRMPEMDGFALIAAMKQKGLSHYAILTGLNDVPLLQESIRLRVEDYLIKPVSKPELFALIDRVREALSASSENETAALARHFQAADLEDGEILRRLVSQMRRSDCPPENLRRFLKEAGRRLPYWETCRLAARLLREGASADSLAADLRALPLAIQSTSPEINQILQALETRFPENITLGGMAAEVYLQPNYLTTLFRRETDIGFVQYLNQLRVDHACRLLLTQPGLTMTEIAPQCGFASERYFFTTFRRWTGVTPGEFREELAAGGFIRA